MNTLTFVDFFIMMFDPIGGLILLIMAFAPTVFHKKFISLRKLKKIGIALICIGLIWQGIQSGMRIFEIDHRPVIWLWATKDIGALLIIMDMCRFFYRDKKNA